MGAVCSGCSVDMLEDICHQILDLYSQMKQQIPHHTPISSSSPQIFSLHHKCHKYNSHDRPKALSLPSPHRDSQQSAQWQQQVAQQPKKPSPQPSPSREIKRAVVVSPKEENKAAEPPPPKIPKIDTTHPPMPLAHPPLDRKPPLIAPLSEAKPPGPVDASNLPKVQIPLWHT